MADFKLVGAVAIKVRPDASKFRKETQKQVSEQLAGYKAEVKVEAKVKADTTEMKTDVEKAKKEVEAKKMTLKVGLDYDSVRKAEAQLEAAVKGLEAKKVKVKLDPAGIAKARQELDDMKRDADIEMAFVPDEKGYKAVLAKIAEVRRQKMETQIHFGWSEEELAAKEAEMKAALEDSLVMQIHYGNDRDSIQRMIDQVNAELDKIKEIRFDTKLDEESLKTTKEILQNELRRTPVEIKVNYKDQASLKAARDRLKAMLTQIGEEPLKIKFDEKHIKRELARINSMIEEELPATIKDTTVRIKYNNNKTSIEKAIAEIDAALADINAVKIDVELNSADLIFAKARLQEELRNQTVKLEYDPNLAGLQAVKARLQELLGIGKLHINTTLDEADLRKNLALVDAAIAEHERNALKIKTKISPAEYLKTLAAIKILTKDQTVNIFTRVRNSSLLLAAAKLTGLRAASRWTQEFAKTLGTLDRNLPIVAAAVIAVSTLASGVLSLTANIFSLGNGLGEVIRMAGLLAPTMILGLSSVLIVLKAVFKDFGAAIHGIDAAMKRLPASGQEAARIFRTIFADIREQLSKQFWDKASDGMLRFAKTALPAFGAGLAKLSGSLGGIFSNILDSFTRLTKQGGIKLFFDNMSHGFNLAQTGLADFMDAFNTLAVSGSTVFPRMGRSFNEFAAKFDAWVNRINADGSLQRWLDIGIQGMKDLFHIGSDLVKVWGNIGTAAQAAGAFTLHSFSAAMSRLDDITSGARFQRNMKLIFQGARDASDAFHKALGSLGPAMDTFSVTVKNTLTGAGRALGSFIAVIGDVISSPRVNTGLTAFLSGIEQMFISLRPAAGAVAEILQTFGQILGQVATDSGPLFRTLFIDLASVLTVAWAALQPFLPELIQIGTNILGVLAPALTAVARVAIPAFADAVLQLGDGLLPVIKFMADFAAGAVIMISSLPLPWIVGLATGIVGVVTALRLAVGILPATTLAMQALGVTSALTAARMQLIIPGIGIILAAATAIGAAALTSFATAQSNATPYANEYADALLADAKAAGTFTGAIGEATTAVALHKLVDSGAYQAAEKLGIAHDTVTEALLHEGAARDEVRNKITAAKKEYTDNEKLIQKSRGTYGELTKEIRDNNDAAGILGKTMDENQGSLQKAINDTKLWAEVAKKAGISVTGEAIATEGLWTSALKAAKGLGQAAAATTVLTDKFSSTASKVDAMRKTLEILVPEDAAQKTAKNLGEYAKGLNDIRDSAVALKPDMVALGEAAYGKNGLLNIESGNKVVMQLNQALVDQVDNTWAGAKAAYDAALAQGKNVVQAFNDAQTFVRDHKKDYDQLATDSGIASDRVQAQWERVFGKEWVLKVSLEGATEAAAKAQALMTAIGQKFDGQRFQAFLDANPDQALLAVTNADQAAKNFVNSEYKAKLDALPKPAQDAITALLKSTNKDWVEGDFESILRVAKDVPGLAEAILQIMKGAGADYKAIIFAQANGISVEAARRQLDGLTARRTAYVDVIIRRSELPDLNGPAVSGNGRFGTVANGGIFKARTMADLFKGQFKAGMIKAFANGGIEKHVAQIQRAGGPVRIWAEPETKAEAYIPYASAKRPRSEAILKQVAKDFGFTLVRNTSQFADGGMNGAATATPTRTSTTSVTVGTINTVDPDAAVRKLRTLQRDALAVAGIH